MRHGRCLRGAVPTRKNKQKTEIKNLLPILGLSVLVVLAGNSAGAAVSEAVSMFDTSNQVSNIVTNQNCVACQILAQNKVTSGATPTDKTGALMKDVSHVFLNPKAPILFPSVSTPGAPNSFGAQPSPYGPVFGNFASFNVLDFSQTAVDPMTGMLFNNSDFWKIFNSSQPLVLIQ